MGDKASHQPLKVPRAYNASYHFVDRHIDVGHGERVAFVDESGSHTYAVFFERVGQVAAARDEAPQVAHRQLLRGLVVVVGVDGVGVGGGA